MAKGISGIGVAAAFGGGLFLWSAIKGASISETLRDLLSGQQPTGEKTYPITATVAEGLVGGAANLGSGGGQHAQQILTKAASLKDFLYCFGGGHGASALHARCLDCSGYVSRVLEDLGLLRGTLTTGGFAKYGNGVPYAQRAPGDLIIWNGGTGGGHMGIIATVSGNGGTMWNNPCTGCGGVKLSRYPYGSRTATAAIIRRP